MVAVRNFAGVLLAATLVAGCAGIRDHRGAVLDPQLTAAIQPGIDNRESVTKTLGRPTFTGQFDDKDWFYLSSDTRSFAFRNPRVVEQTLLHVRFDDSGNVASVSTSGKEKVASITPSGDKTPTLGHQRGFFEELFGSIGSVTQPGLPGNQQRGQ